MCVRHLHKINFGKAKAAARKMLKHNTKERTKSKQQHRIKVLCKDQDKQTHAPYLQLGDWGTKKGKSGKDLEPVRLLGTGTAIPEVGDRLDNRFVVQTEQKLYMRSNSTFCVEARAHTHVPAHKLPSPAQTQEYHVKKEYRSIQHKPSSFVALNSGTDHTNALTERKVIEQQFEVCITLCARGCWNADEKSIARMCGWLCRPERHIMQFDLFTDSSA